MLFNISFKKKPHQIGSLIVAFVRILLSSFPSVPSSCTCYQSLFFHWHPHRGGHVTLLIIDNLFTEDSPRQTFFYYYCFYYFLSIPEKRGPLPRTICLCFVRCELATSWSHEIKTKCPMCCGGGGGGVAGCSETAARSSSAHQLWSPTGARRAQTAAKLFPGTERSMWAHVLEQNNTWETGVQGDANRDS